MAGIKAQRSGIGITGIRERVRQLKGTLNIRSSPVGTKVAVTLPIASTFEPEGPREKCLPD
jgi:signal transduction histidine kinase